MNKPSRPPKLQATDANMFDLQSHLKIWAINLFCATATKEQKKHDVNELGIRFIWDDVVVTNDKPEYFDNVVIKLPKSHSLFSTTFRNNTDVEQEYSFRTERCTRSIAEIEIQKGVTLSKEFAIKLALPNSLLEANAGFKHELALSSSSRQSTEEELAWGVDTRITVAPKHSASAEVKIVEEQMSCNFRLLTTMSGRIRVLFLDTTRENALIKYLEGDLGTVIEEFLCNRVPKETNAEKLPNIWTESSKSGQRVLFIETCGRCQFRFGIHQDVEVNQKTLTTPDNKYNQLRNQLTNNQLSF